MKYESKSDGFMLMRAPALFLTVLLIGAGCSKTGKPAGLMDKNDMVKTMTEIYLDEQRVATVGVTRDSTAQIFKQISPGMFKKLGTTDSVFRLSFDYYMEHPVEMEQIYTALIDSLNLREQKMISNEVKK